MDPVLAAIWEVIFAALLCLGEAGPIMAGGTPKIQPKISQLRIFEMKIIPPASADEEASTNLRTTPCTNSKEYTIAFTATITTPDEASHTPIATVKICSTITLKVTIGDAPSATGLEGPVSGDAPATLTTSPGVPSNAYEDVSKNAVQRIMDTVSAKTHSAMSSATVGPEGVTTQNKFSATEAERDSSFLQELYSDTEDASLTAKPQNVILPTENTTGSTGGNIYPSVYEDTSTQAMATNFQNATSPPKESFGDAQGNSATCYSDCDAFPAWATALLCMATAFIVFMLVGLLFLIPYCIKLGQPTVMPYSSSPRYSA
uniref:Uncharacterized protein n=1 Tax=Pogona vitticeps TaxID=103695 RepID=A0ABM5FIN9_9SAUR